MRKNLKRFRLTHLLTQQEIADKIGCSRTVYSHVENGKREGRQPFWEGLQDAFAIPECDMWDLMKNEP